MLVEATFVKQKSDCTWFESEGVPSFYENVTFDGGNDMIGGIKVRVECDGHAVYMDFGSDFGTFGEYYGSKRIKYTQGLYPYLSTGVIPPVPHLYKDSIPNYPKNLKELNQMWESSKVFNRADIHRLNLAVKYIHSKSFSVDAIVHSHHHTDHTGNDPFVRNDIPMAGNILTYAIMKAMEEHWGPNWSSNMTFEQRRDLDKEGGAYVVEDRPFIEIRPGEEIQVGPFRIKQVPVSHSAIDTYATILTFPSGKTLLYTGDMRYGQNTLEFMDWLDTQPEFDMFCFDGTNLGSHKSGITEDDVETGLRNRFQEPGNFYVMMQVRHLERITHVIESAKATGRVVVVPLVMAHYIYKMQKYRSINPYIPDINDVHVFLHKVGLGKYEPKEYSNKHLRNIAFEEGLKVVTEDDIAPYLGNNNFIFVLTSMDQVNDFYANHLFSPGGHFIHSTTGPYDMIMQMDLNREIRVIRKLVGYDFDEKRDIIHSSGHFSKKHLVEFLKHVRAKTIVPLHTECPKEAADLLKVMHPESHILWQISRYLPYTIDGKKINLDYLES